METNRFILESQQFTSQSLFDIFMCRTIDIRGTRIFVYLKIALNNWPPTSVCRKSHGGVFDFCRGEATPQRHEPMQMRAPTVTRSWPRRLMGASQALQYSYPPYRLHLLQMLFLYFSLHSALFFESGRGGDWAVKRQGEVHFMHMRAVLLLFWLLPFSFGVSWRCVSHCIKSSSFLRVFLFYFSPRCRLVKMSFFCFFFLLSFLPFFLQEVIFIGVPCFPSYKEGDRH